MSFDHILLNIDMKIDVLIMFIDQTIMLNMKSIIEFEILFSINKLAECFCKSVIQTVEHLSTAKCNDVFPSLFSVSIDL